MNLFKQVSVELFPPINHRKTNFFLFISQSLLEGVVEDDGQDDAQSDDAEDDPEDDDVAFAAGVVAEGFGGAAGPRRRFGGHVRRRDLGRQWRSVVPDWQGFGLSAFAVDHQRASLSLHGGHLRWRWHRRQRSRASAGSSLMSCPPSAQGGRRWTVNHGRRGRRHHDEMCRLLVTGRRRHQELMATRARMR